MKNSLIYFVIPIFEDVFFKTGDKRKWFNLQLRTPDLFEMAAFRILANFTASI